MGRGILLWLLGVPIPIIIILLLIIPSLISYERPLWGVTRSMRSA